MKETISLIQDIIALDQPVFGICLGHQLIALSQGCAQKRCSKATEVSTTR